jgi:hypothetical protein
MSNHCHGLHHTFCEIFTKSDAHLLFLRRIHHEITSGQIHDYK